MSPRFENPKRSAFSLRTAPPNPSREADRMGREKSWDALTRLAAEHPTILDLPGYLERTGRGRLWTDFDTYDKREVERSLLSDLDQALSEHDGKRVSWLRGLILVTSCGPEPLPTQPLNRIKSLVLERITFEENSADARRAASDDTEIEDYAAAQWRQVMILNEKKVFRFSGIKSNLITT